MSHILVTGAAGFIGFHTARRLLRDGHSVVGLDNLNEYYDANLKRTRLRLLQEHSKFSFEKLDLADRSGVQTLFNEHSFDRVVHLAAQAGVRYSLENPHIYVDSNLVGFTNILEGCRAIEVPHLVYASSSSVYGSNRSVPFAETANTDHPLSLYAATKKANELMAHTYSHLFRIPTTGLRFFTVYGPWGRPDMALFKFTKAILAGDPIDVYNRGEMERDFTYVDDIVNGIVGVLDQPATPVSEGVEFEGDPSISDAPFRLHNIGNNSPVTLLDMIEVLERCLGRTAEKRLLPLQAGDVQATYACIDSLHAATGFQPETTLEDGIRSFVDWYHEYHNI